MKQFLPIINILGVLFSLSVCAWAQPPQLPEPLYAQNFDGDITPWVGLGEGSKASVDRAIENVKQGTGVLRFDYKVAAGTVNLLVSPIAPHSLDTLRSISFWIKANRNASLVFALQEQGGGRFGTIFSVIANQWQQVEIAPDDLILQTGSDDPKDENDKLDMDKVEAVAIMDFDLIFAQSATPNTPLTRLFGLQYGPRTLYIDDLVFSSKPLSPEPKENALIDDFKHPQAAWLKIGDMTLETIQDGGTKINSLQANYTQSTAHLTALAKPIPIGILAKKKELSFELASRRKVTLIVQLEEKSGGKYNATLEVPGDETPATQTLSFDDFKRSDDSKDDDDRLDVEQVKQLFIIDASAMIGQCEGENTLWLSQLRAK
ncbi:hypothetical protein IAD21_03249 [Abditibacteriota bacterium]|nr:hypothetical protein IAD21_03249 [Abditibacteriota bacterium]